MNIREAIRQLKSAVRSWKPVCNYIAQEANSRIGRGFAF